MEARAATAACASPSAGLARCHALSDALDEALRTLAGRGPLDGLAVVAVGGYGRREQCRHSDIDVMLLLEGGGPPDAVQRVLYPLWDAGLKVGHSVRTVEQAAQAAAQNVQTLTALIDARLVAGDAALWQRLCAARQGMARRLRGTMRRELAAQQRMLIAREPWQLQEPDLKKSRGGLRALQAVHWLNAADALAAGREPPPLDAPLAALQECLLVTRNALHALSERANDRFRQDLVAPVAEWLGVDRTQWSRALFGAMRAIDATASARLDGTEPDRALRRRWWFGGAPAPQEADASPAGGSDLDLLRHALRRGTPAGLDPLPPADWLARVLPEWEVLRCLPHIAPFHRHPVDVHSMRTVDEARHALRVDEDSTLTTTAAAALPDEDEVLLAALLHDIGKGHPGGDHSQVGGVIAERFAARAGLDPEMERRLSAVARLHLLLPTVATRRDIADERVIRETAAQVGDARTLHLLYVTSVADARASGPDVWSPWKAQLMRSLYLRTLNKLEAVAGGPGDAPAHEAAAVQALAGNFDAETVRGHLRQLPPSYVLSTPPETIGHHLELIAAAAEADGTAVRRDGIERLDRLTVVTRDRPGILSLVAGTLAAHNASVLGGVAYTRDDGTAIQVMHVSDALERGIDERRWSRILDAVPRALSGEFAVDEQLRETRATYRSAPRASIPTSVQIDNNDSERYSIVEVHAADRLGLLYVLTRTLHSLALDIHVAKVDTIGPEVVDAFYVRRENGRRLEKPDEIERVRRRIVEAVAAMDSGQ